MFLLGGIGNGFASQGVPAIAAITRGLAERFELDVYSLGRPHAAFRPHGYALHSPPESLAHPVTRKLRWSWLAAQFLAAHWNRRYDEVFSFWGYPMGLFAVALARLVRRPSVIALLGAEAASVPSIGYGQMRRPATRRLVLGTCARASKVVVLSEQQRTNLRRHGLRRDDVEVIPFGVDPRLFERKISERRPPLKILHVANLTEVKDQATLLRGFALLRGHMAATLRIVGEGSLRGGLESLAARLGVQDDVAFLGPLPYASIPAQFQWADTFVLTSLSEGQSTALTEAAMSGVLQVSTPVGCIIDQGEDAAVVIRPGDPLDLATKIQAIAANDAEWQRKLSRARAWAESHDLHWTVNELARVIEEACLRRPTLIRPAGETR